MAGAGGLDIWGGQASGQQPGYDITALIYCSLHEQDPIITKLNLPLATMKLIACNVHIWQRHSANKITREHPGVTSLTSFIRLNSVRFNQDN